MRDVQQQQARLEEAFERIEETILPCIAMMLDTLLDASANLAELDPKVLIAELQTLAAELEELTRAVERSSPIHVEPGEYRIAEPALSDQPRVKRRVDIAARQQHDRFRHDFRLAGKQCRERNRAAGLDDQADAPSTPSGPLLSTSSSLTASPVAPRAVRMPKVIGDTRGVWSASHSVGGAIRADRHDLAELERAAHVVPALGLDRNDRRRRDRRAQSPKSARRRRN